MDGKSTVSSSPDTDIHIQHANLVKLSIAQSCYLGFVWGFISTADKLSFPSSMIRLLEQCDVKMASVTNAECKK